MSRVVRRSRSSHWSTRSTPCCSTPAWTDRAWRDRPCHPGPASATGVISSRGIHQLRRSRLALVRLPWRPRATPRDPGHLHQRRERCGPLRAHDVLRPRGRSEVVDLGHRRHRPRWRRRGVWSRRRRRDRDGRRAGPHPAPARRDPGAGATDTALQLRSDGRRRELRLADRDRGQPPSVLAGSVPRSPALRGIAAGSRQTRSRLR